MEEEWQPVNEPVPAARDALGSATDQTAECARSLRRWRDPSMEFRRDGFRPCANPQRREDGGGEEREKKVLYTWPIA